MDRSSGRDRKPVEWADSLGYHAGVGTLLQEPTMDNLVRRPETEAVRHFFDSRNGRLLFRSLFFVTAAVLVVALVSIATERYRYLFVTGLNLALIRVLYSTSEHRRMARHFRQILPLYLAVQFLLFRMLVPFGSPSAFDVLFPLTLLAFRLQPLQLALPLGASWASYSGVKIYSELAKVFDSPWGIVAQTIWCVILFAWVVSGTRGAEKEFLANWRRESRRARERERMKGELDDARRIQLSMLPRRDPDLPWMDAVGISIPASEVGGDYYGYFQPTPRQLAVVVADVAGHGVASGLVLSGIRAGLHLLHEQPHPPDRLLERLDRMVRHTSGKRHFVTMIYALFDSELGTVTVATAGHPPMLHYHAADGAVEEVGSYSRPLGTSLPGKAVQVTVPFGPDDAFVLYTDGIAETLDQQDNAYSGDRLASRLGDFTSDRSAHELRNTLLGDVVTFKGDREQTDDITIVVLKAR